MAEYDVAFGEKLAEAAQMVASQGLTSLDAQRTVLYLSLLSVEISLKAVLEHAGKPVSDIRARSHRLVELLADVDQCEVEVEVVAGVKQYVPGSRLRSCSLRYGEAETTVGNVIDAGANGASLYPNQIRYGDVLRHFPPEIVLQLANKVSAFARQHWGCFRL